MTAPVEPTLYIDIQRIPPAGYCPACGAELYRPSLDCCRCREDRP